MVFRVSVDVSYCLRFFIDNRILYSVYISGIYIRKRKWKCKPHGKGQMGKLLPQTGTLETRQASK